MSHIIDLTKPPPSDFPLVKRPPSWQLILLVANLPAICPLLGDSRNNHFRTPHYLVPMRTTPWLFLFWTEKHKIFVDDWIVSKKLQCCVGGFSLLLYSLILYPQMSKIDWCLVLVATPPFSVLFTAGVDWWFAVFNRACVSRERHGKTRSHIVMAKMYFRQSSYQT